MNLWQVSVIWSNPYTNQPEGLPRVLHTEVYDAETIRPTDIPAIKALLEDFVINGGYCCTISQEFDEEKTRRRWSRESKAKLRRKNLKKRIIKKLKKSEEQLPLLGDPVQEMFERELEKKPDYYAGGDAHIQVEAERAAQRRIELQKYRDKMRKGERNEH